VAVPLPPIDELDRLDTADFAGTLARIFEPNPLLLERLAARRPFRSYAELISAARDIVTRMSDAERTALLASHPRIGAGGAMSEASRREQAGAASATVDAELAGLQTEYERRFGFRFVTFVDRRPRHAILEELRARLTHSRDVELAAGVGAYLAICADRAGVAAA
jgi:2-oxo-4-hydroxy-4-carboxy--5-ureidoimidazoline (OHCU) decarboxylase